MINLTKIHTKLLDAVCQTFALPLANAQTVLFCFLAHPNKSCRWLKQNFQTGNVPNFYRSFAATNGIVLICAFVSLCNCSVERNGNSTPFQLIV